MWLDLRRLNDEPCGPPGLSVGLVEGEADWELDDLPHYSREMAAARFTASKARLRRVWHFGAWLAGRPVGHCTLFVTTGRLGIAGIWGCGVVPHARNQGIGRAVTLGACRFAREMGCRYAMLNATGMGEPVYRRLGFEPVGAGGAWWLEPETLAAPPPTPLQIALAEAAARGDVSGLAALAAGLDRETLDARLPSTATLIELAARARQPEAVACLEQLGATLDLLSAWDLGWKERVPVLLAARPELAEHRWGRGHHAPLHLAADRGDLELARTLLEGGADTEVADGGGGTPLHYAAWRGHVEIARLLLARQACLETVHDQVGTPLTSAIRGLAAGAAPGADHLEVMARLIDAGARVDGPDPAHQPLPLAVRLRLVPVVRLLLNRGGAVDLADAEGKTAMELARAAGNGEMVERVARGPDLQPDWN
jgi:ankyrin repeat protein/GNAT superfamily N-acetyltransferase